jgi:hypothetical protein
MARMLSPLQPDTVLYIAVVALICSLASLIFTLILNRKLSRFMVGKDGKTFEGAVRELVSRTNDFATFRKELEEYLKKADARIARSIQGVATVRFNPFHGEGLGGNQSFATAFLDEAGNGVVISTLYARDRVSVFGKPVEKGTSSYELTEEEIEAVRKARLPRSS